MFPDGAFGGVGARPSWAEDWQLLRGRPCAEDVKQGELGVLGTAACWVSLRVH